MLPCQSPKTRPKKVARHMFQVYEKESLSADHQGLLGSLQWDHNLQHCFTLWTRAMKNWVWK